MIILICAFLYLLALCLKYIKISKAYYRTDAIKTNQEPAKQPAYAKQETYHCRICAKADYITKGVNLHPKKLLFLCPVLFASGNLPIKHITQARKRQTEDCRTKPSINCLRHANHRNRQPDIRKDYCIIITTNKLLFLFHFHPLSFFILPLSHFYLL